MASNTHVVDIRLREHQLQVIRSLRRFNTLLAHRRFGKTTLAVYLLLIKALQCPYHRPQVHYYAPSFGQAKRVAWATLKDVTKDIPGVVHHEGELKVSLPNGGIIQLGSADNPDSSRGIYSDYIVLDEPAQMPPSMWTQVLRPALSDRKGGMLAIGTPNGRSGLFYDLYNLAQEEDDWNSWIYKASETGIIDADELRAAKVAMSQPEFEQEFECSWDAAIKGAYYQTEMSELVRYENILYDPQRPVYVTMDLGMSDATAAWWFQLDGDEVRFIQYQEYVNSALPDILASMTPKPTAIIAPHDIEVRSLSTGITRRQTLENLGVTVYVAPKMRVLDGIEHTRMLLRRSVFNPKACHEGIEALRHYRSDWIEKKGVLSLNPVHDWSSHGADAVRTLAQLGTKPLANEWSRLDYSQYDKRLKYA